MTALLNTRRWVNYFRAKRSAIFPKKYTRDQYKAVWNSVSKTEDDAKMAVSGCVDEASYVATGHGSVEMLRNLVGVNPDDIILEIGAGVGRVGSALAPLCREWIAVDVSENMLAHIKRRLSHLNNVRTVATSGYDLAPIPSRSVDLVYCTVVFMHLDEWERYSYIAEGFRILRPGGRMLVDNINLASDEGWKLFEEHRVIAPAERPAQISKTSTPQELEIYFKRAGFVKVAHEEDGCRINTYGIKPADNS